MFGKYVTLILVICLFSYKINAQDYTQKDATVPTPTPTTVVKVFKEANGWGYDIFVDEKKYIHQTTIPSVPGTVGFKTEADAKKVGEFTATKIKKNIMPPSVTPEELDSLGVYNLKK